MLAITRNIGSSFTIGDDITITILAINGRQVRIGIDAPKHVEIKRDDMIKEKPKS